LKQIRVKLKTITPLHIGGADDELLPTQFDFYRNTVYVMSEEHLSRYLVKENLQSKYIEYIRNERYPSLSQFTKNLKLDSEIREQCMLYTCKGRFSPNKLRPFLRDAYHKPYIPGSSIKGAIRVATLYCLLKNLAGNGDKILSQTVEKRLKRFDEAQRKNRNESKDTWKKGFLQKLEADLLQNFNLPNTVERSQRDIFRALEVRDCEPFDRDSLEVNKIVVENSRRNFKIYPECLPAHKSFEINIRINTDLLAHFARAERQDTHGISFTDIETLLLDPIGTLKKFGCALDKREEEFSKRKAFPSTPEVRLGWGGGLLGITVDLLLEKQLLEDVRNKLFDPRQGFPAPKTRRLTVDGFSLGWCKVLPSEEAEDTVGSYTQKIQAMMEQRRQEEQAHQAEAERQATLREQTQGKSKLYTELFIISQNEGWHEKKEMFVRESLIERWLDKFEADPQADAIQYLKELIEHHFAGLTENPEAKRGRQNKFVFKPRQRAFALRMAKLVEEIPT